MAMFAPAESLPSPATLGDRRKSIPIMGIRQVSWELSFAFIMKPIKSIFDAIYMKGGNGSTRAINECRFHRKICKVLNRFTRFPKKIFFGLELWAKEVQNAGSGTLPHRIAKDFYEQSIKYLGSFNAFNNWSFSLHHLLCIFPPKTEAPYCWNLLFLHKFDWFENPDWTWNEFRTN